MEGHSNLIPFLLPSISNETMGLKRQSVHLQESKNYAIYNIERNRTPEVWNQQTYGKSKNNVKWKKSASSTK